MRAGKRVPGPRSLSRWPCGGRLRNRKLPGAFGAGSSSTMEGHRVIHCEQGDVVVLTPLGDFCTREQIRPLAGLIRSPDRKKILLDLGRVTSYNTAAKHFLTTCLGRTWARRKFFALCGAEDQVVKLVDHPNRDIVFIFEGREDALEKLSTLPVRSGTLRMEHTRDIARVILNGAFLTRGLETEELERLLKELIYNRCPKIFVDMCAVTMIDEKALHVVVHDIVHACVYENVALCLCPCFLPVRSPSPWERSLPAVKARVHRDAYGTPEEAFEALEALHLTRFGRGLVGSSSFGGDFSP